MDDMSTGAAQDPAETLEEIARELESELETVQSQLADNEKHAREIDEKPAPDLTRT